MATSQVHRALPAVLVVPPVVRPVVLDNGPLRLHEENQKTFILVLPEGNRLYITVGGVNIHCVRT